MKKIDFPSNRCVTIISILWCWLIQHKVCKINFNVGLNGVKLLITPPRLYGIRIAEVGINIKQNLKPKVRKSTPYQSKQHNIISTSKPKNIYFSCQIKWLNIFLVKSFSYCQINLTWKVNLFKPFTWKILFNSLRNCKEN